MRLRLNSDRSSTMAAPEGMKRPQSAPRDCAAAKNVCLAANPTNLIIPWDWSVLQCRVVSQVKEDFVHVTPAPAFGRIITLNDQVTSCMIMMGRMTTWRLIATTNVSASPADSEMNPFAAGFQTLLAPARTRSNLPDGTQMCAAFTHGWWGAERATKARELAFAG